MENKGNVILNLSLDFALDIIQYAELLEENGSSSLLNRY